MWHFLTYMLLVLLISTGEPLSEPSQAPVRLQRPWVASVVAQEDALRTTWFDALEKDDRTQIQKLWARDEELSYLYYVRDKDGCRAWEWAIYHNNSKLFSQLTDYGSYSSSVCYHPCTTHIWLHHAVRQRNLMMLKFLVEDCKVDVNVKDAEGKVALDYAWEVDWPEAACFLGSYWASVEKAHNTYQILRWALFQDDTELMRLLLPRADLLTILLTMQDLLEISAFHASERDRERYALLADRASECAQKHVGTRLMYLTHSAFFGMIQARVDTLDAFGPGDSFSYTERLFCSLGMIFALSSSSWIAMFCCRQHKVRLSCIGARVHSAGSWLEGVWEDVRMVQKERSHRSALASLPDITLPPEIIELIIAYVVVPPKRGEQRRRAQVHRLFVMLAQCKHRFRKKLRASGLLPQREEEGRSLTSRRSI